jgi:AraC-like DNA-binding protein
MAISSRMLASGAGWSVSDLVCTAGPGDRCFEEQHRSMCIALVTDGTFEYRATQGSGLMSPGSLLLGNAGTCFECGHQHGRGDRCLSFQFSPDWFEQVAAEVPGTRKLPFPAARMPPVPALLPLIFAAHSAREQEADDSQFHELTMRLAGAVCASLSSSPRARRTPSLRDEQRVALALRHIEARPRERLTLDELATEVASSPYHFLRVFEQVVGVTPGQYLLRERMRRAAVRLRNSNDSVSAIALDTGFGDLSTFNRHFRRMLGASPSAFRGRAVLRDLRNVSAQPPAVKPRQDIRGRRAPASVP